MGQRSSVEVQGRRKQVAGWGREERKKQSKRAKEGTQKREEGQQGGAGREKVQKKAREVCDCFLSSLLSLFSLQNILICRQWGSDKNNL